MSRAAFFASVVLVCLVAPREGFTQPPMTIRVYDSAGDEWIPAIDYPAPTQVRLRFGVFSFSGVAYLS